MGVRGLGAGEFDPVVHCIDDLVDSLLARFGERPADNADDVGDAIQCVDLLDDRGHSLSVLFRHVQTMRRETTDDNK